MRIANEDICFLEEEVELMLQDEMNWFQFQKQS